MSCHKPFTMLFLSAAPRTMDAAGLSFSTWRSCPARSSPSISASTVRRASVSVAPAARRSPYRSARCCASSSAISAARSAASGKPASRRSISFFHSGMFGPGHALDGLDEGCPAALLRRQNFASQGCQAVIPAPPLPGLFHPPSLDPAALLQPVQQRIQRRHMEAQGASGALLNELADLVAMPRAAFYQRQDQQLRTALLQLAVEDCLLHICHSNIYGRR